MQGYQVLICYRSEEYGELGEALESRLKNFGITVFRDVTGLVPGERYPPQWLDKLDQEPDPKYAPGVGPTVVLLATPPGKKENEIDKNPDEPDHVLDEIILALSPSKRNKNLIIPIVILRFGESGYEFIKMQVRKYVASSAVVDPQNYELDVYNRDRAPLPENIARRPKDITPEQWVAICRPVLRSVRSYFQRKLLEQLRITREWANEILQQRLSRASIDKVVESLSDRVKVVRAIADLAATRDPLKAVVITGVGGVGKTYLLARCLLDALSNSNGFFPIVLHGFTQEAFTEQLRNSLGLNWSGDVSLSLNDEGLDQFKGQICLVIDSLERAPDLNIAARAAEALRGFGKIIITARPEGWSRAAPALSVPDNCVFSLGDLDESSVEKLLNWHFRGRGGSFLRRLIFLDMALYLTGERGARSIGRQPQEDIWRSESELLQEFFEKAVEPGPSEQNPDPIIEQRKKLLRDLAMLQLEEQRFDVSVKKLTNNDSSKYRHLRWLTDSGRIAVESADEQTTVRLRHDVVDSFNIAGVVRGAEDRQRRALELLRRGFGQVVWDGIIQSAIDFNDEDCLNAFFDEFLRLVENKKVKIFQAAGWNAQSVVVAEIDAFKEAIRTVLCGELVSRPDTMLEGDAITRLGVGKLTQETLSSVGALLSVMPLGSFEDPTGELLSAFMRHIPKADWSGRLVEALPRLARSREAFAYFNALCRNDEEIRKDLGIVPFLSRAAVDFARLSSSNINQVIELLDHLAGIVLSMSDRHRPLLLRAISNARQCIVEKSSGISIERQPFTLEEIEEGLSTYNYDAPEDYSDWKQVEYYLDEVAEVQASCDERARERVLLAVGRALWHEMTRCHARAIKLLSTVNHPFARGILLYLLTFEDVDVTETALIEAIEAQGKCGTTRPECCRRLRDAFVRACALRARLLGGQRSEELEFVARRLGKDAGLIATDAFIGRPVSRDVQIKLLEGASSPMPGWLSENEKSVEVGKEIERKLVFVSLSHDRETISAAPSTWAKPRRFHAALLERRDFFSRLAVQRKAEPTMRPEEYSVSKNAPRWQHQEREGFAAHIEGVLRSYAAFESGTVLPGIACLHAIVRTNDGLVLEAQRSHLAHYAPGAWACSFEEQFKREDLEAEDPIMACFQRGLEEEFKISVNIDREAVVALMYGVEWDIQNYCILIAVDLPYAKAELNVVINPKEIEQYRFIREEEAQQRVGRSAIGFVYNKDTKGEALHPTSLARLSMLVP
jgi:hypothetical protein